MHGETVKLIYNHIIYKKKIRYLFTKCKNKKNSTVKQE